jgi:hypothetical protein
MKYKIILSLLVLISYGAQAQMEIDKMERLALEKTLVDSDHKLELNLSGNYFYNSNSVTNSFIGSLLYKGAFIDDAAKDRESKRLKKYNRLGVDESISLNGKYKIGNNRSVLFGINQRAFAGAHFSNDLFEMVFRGNAPFAGEDLNLKKTKLQIFDYQSIYIGLQKESEDGKYTLGASASFIRGGRYYGLKMKNMSMYTDPAGQYINLNGDLNFSKTVSDSNTSPLKSHGIGASVNLFFSLKNETGRLNMEVRDLGFIEWRDVKSYSGNSNFQYNGILINDLLSSGSSLASDITLDSIATSAGITVETKNKMMFLPTTFHVNYVFMPNKKFTRTIGVRYMLAPGYIPRIYLREADELGKNFILVNTISYGGFGRFDYELGFMKSFGKKETFIAALNLFAFEYLVLPGKSSGHGLNLGLTKLF